MFFLEVLFWGASSSVGGSGFPGGFSVDVASQWLKASKLELEAALMATKLDAVGFRGLWGLWVGY